MHAGFFFTRAVSRTGMLAFPLGDRFSAFCCFGNVLFEPEPLYLRIEGVKDLGRIDPERKQDYG